MTRRLPTPAQDIALLLARVVTGAVLIAHGWKKLVTNGVAGTTEGFEGMGVAVAPVAAVIAIIIELLGGVLLVTGAATAVVGVVVALEMLGAALFVHASAAVFVTAGGWELVGVIGAAALALAAMVPGGSASTRPSAATGAFSPAEHIPPGGRSVLSGTPRPPPAPDASSPLRLSRLLTRAAPSVGAHRRR